MMMTVRSKEPKIIFLQMKYPETKNEPENKKKKHLLPQLINEAMEVEN
jgi:hypothetical protein